MSLVEQIKALTNKNMDLTNKNMDLTNKNMDLTNKIIDICNTPKSVTNNTANSHKTFNMNFFLNETCKDAMNMGEFVSMIQPKLEELEDTGRLGYVTGISNIILKQLNGIEKTDRPLHCRDLKREVLYVKDNDEWIKETDEKTSLVNAIKIVAHRNMINISKWQDNHPGYCDGSSKHNNTYLHIVSNSMAGGSSEEIHKNMSKIVSNIVKEVVISTPHVL